MMTTAELLFLSRLRRHARPNMPAMPSTPALRAPSVRAAILSVPGLADSQVREDVTETYAEAFRRHYGEPLRTARPRLRGAA